MAEIVSREVARKAANSTGYGKQVPTDYGKVVGVLITSPAVVAWANGDTLGSGVRLPKGTRFMVAGQVSCQAMGASVVADIGIRNFDTGAIIDADGIGAAINVATAGTKAANGGVFVAAGANYVTDQDSELYVTFSGATPTANTQFRAEMLVMLP